MTGLSDLALAQPLMVIAIVAILLASAGWMIERDRPGLALALRRSGYLGMLATGLLLIGQLANEAERSDAKLVLGQRPSLMVEGASTVVPMASDGHFWVTAKVNGVAHDFLIDTGATYTGMSRSAAAISAIEPLAGTPLIELDTANGVIEARINAARTFTFGNVAAAGLQIAVPEHDQDKTNVIGMNFLSGLKSWRVEGNRLILEP